MVGAIWKEFQLSQLTVLNFRYRLPNSLDSFNLRTVFVLKAAADCL